MLNFSFCELQIIIILEAWLLVKLSQLVGFILHLPYEFDPQNLPVISLNGLVAESMNLANHTFHGI